MKFIITNILSLSNKNYSFAHFVKEYANSNDELKTIPVDNTIKNETVVNIYNIFPTKGVTFTNVTTIVNII